jgi:Taurine catabolism dioxygenase TauD, TfdA family
MSRASPIDIATVPLPGQQHYEEASFPTLVENRTAGTTLDTVVSWLATSGPEVAAHAERCGAVLLRGFPVASADDFDRFIAAFDLPNFPYDDSLSNAVRINRTARVFTANEAPPDVAIPLHHEMAQTPLYPAKLFFFCEKAAESGGATPICRSDVLWEQLSHRCPAFARACATKGLRYANIMPSEDDFGSGIGRSWQSTLKAQTRELAEARLQKMSYDWEWLDDGCLRAVTPILPAVRDLPDGRRVFFNQMIAATRGWKDKRNDPSRSLAFGDGSPLDPEAVAVLAELGEALAFDLPWQTGDVVLIDNYRAMHGRRTFTGTRKVLASLVAGDTPPD